MPRNKRPLAIWLIIIVCLTVLMCIGQPAVSPSLNSEPFTAASTSMQLNTTDSLFSDSTAISEDNESACSKNKKLLSYLQDHLPEQPIPWLVLLFLLVPLLQSISSIYYRYSPLISSHERRLHLWFCNFRE